MIVELRRSLARGGPPARLFVVILVVWLAFPFVPGLGFAQDAVPTIVAGDLVDDDPDAVYGEGIYDLEPAFYAETCTYAPPTQDCDDVGVAFLSAPLALPIARVVALLPATVGIALLRLVTAGAFVLGMLVLWKRLAPRDPSMPRLLFFTALALTPLVLVSIVLGTTSALLFASACLGLAGTQRPRRAAAVGAIWAVNVVFRGFPIVLGALLVGRRRWLVLGTAAVIGLGLTLLWLVVAPASLLDEFARSTGAVASDAPANIYNGSLDSALFRLVGDAAGEPSDPASVVVRAIFLTGGVWALLRLRTVDAQWAYASLLALLVVPLVWSHYLGLAVPALAYALLERESREPRPLARHAHERRLGAWLPLTALAVSLAAATSEAGQSAVLLRFLVLLAALVAVPLLARAHRRPSPRLPAAEQA